MGTPDEFARFHHPDYVAAVIATEAAGRVSDEVRHRHHIGGFGNPVFPEIFRRPATAYGGSILPPTC